MTKTDRNKYMAILELKKYPFTLPELTSAWKKVARKCHPDHLGGSVKLMQFVNEAYMELQNVIMIEPKKTIVTNKIVNNFMRQMKEQTTKSLRKRYAAGDERAGEALKDWE